MDLDPSAMCFDPPRLREVLVRSYGANIPATTGMRTILPQRPIYAHVIARYQIASSVWITRVEWPVSAIIRKLEARGD